MDIVIPGFDAKFPNDTYLRDANINGKGKISATQVIQLDRYKMPHSGELLELIRTAAEKSMKRKRVSCLGKYIKKVIPDIEERRRIASGEDSIIDRIRMAIPYSYHDEGRDYLRITHGIVPQNEIIQVDENDMDPGMFSWLIEEHGYNQWSTATRLEEGLCLPSDMDIQFAFENRIFNSSLLIVDCDNNPFLYPEIERISRRVYMALRIGCIGDLEDVSWWVKEKTARKTLRTYVREKDIYKCFEDEGDDGRDEKVDEGGKGEIELHSLLYGKPFSKN